MKPILPALAICVALTACQASGPDSWQTKRSSSHWNAGSAGESTSLAFLGANSGTNEDIATHTRNNSGDIALTLRRHLLNDNPDNPLQEHRYEPGQDYIPIYHGPLYALGDAWDMTRTAGINAAKGTWAAVKMPVHVFGGTHIWNPGVQAPPPPSEFRVLND